MKILPKLLVSVIFTSIFFFSCNNAEKDETNPENGSPGFDLAAARNEIEATNRTFMELFLKADSAGIGNLYTSNAKLMFAGQPSVVGRTNIQSAFSQILNSGVTKVNISTQEVYGSEDLLVEEGLVTVYSGERAVGADKTLIIWKKEDGKWKIYRDMANSNTK